MLKDIRLSLHLYLDNYIPAAITDMECLLETRVTRSLHSAVLRVHSLVQIPLVSNQERELHREQAAMCFCVGVGGRGLLTPKTNTGRYKIEYSFLKPTSHFHSLHGCLKNGSRLTDTHTHIISTNCLKH